MTIDQIEAALRTKLTHDLATEERGHQIHLAIREVLKSFVGKKLTKRFTDKVTTAVSPCFPTPPVCFYPHPGKLVVWHHTVLPYDKRELYFIAPEPSIVSPTHSTAHPTLEGFEYEDQCHGKAAAERNEERRDLLDEQSPTLRSLAEKIHEVRASQERLRAFCQPFDNGLRYEAERIVDEKE